MPLASETIIWLNIIGWVAGSLLRCIYCHKYWACVKCNYYHEYLACVRCSYYHEYLACETGILLWMIHLVQGDWELLPGELLNYFAENRLVATMPQPVFKISIAYKKTCSRLKINGTVSKMTDKKNLSL